MFVKIFSLAASALFSVGILGLAPPPERGEGPLPPPRRGERPGPEDDLQKAYGLLRKLRAEIQTNSHIEPRIRDWTDRAVAFYCEGLEDHKRGDMRLSHEHGAIAHDLARASDHAHTAMLYDRAGDDLPKPPAPEGAGEIPHPIRHDLRKTHDRLVEEPGGPDARLYRDAARDLYNAARRDAEAGRFERAAELARAAEAMTHVIEHLGHAAGISPRDNIREFGPEPEPKDEPKAKARFDDPIRKRDIESDRIPPPL